VFGPTQPVNNYNIHFKVPPFPNNPADIALETKGWDGSAYALAQLKLWKNRVQLTGTGRKIVQRQEATNRASGDVTPLNETSPLMTAVSLLVKPKEEFSLYTTASKWIQPASTSLANGSSTGVWPSDTPNSVRNEMITLQPKTTLFEVGARAQFFKGKVTMSLVRYREEATGNQVYTTGTFLRSDGSSFPYSHVIPGNAVVKGWEFEAFGQISHRLSFLVGGELGVSSNQLGSYAGAPLASKLSGVGDEVFAYAKYNFGKDEYDGLSITAGEKTIFSGWNYAWTAWPTPTDFPDNETTVDLGLSYGFNHKYKVFVKGNNLFHTQAMALGINSVIQGRSIWAGVITRF
jgi:outer membrane receptor protein involved in Fe transport